VTEATQVNAAVRRHLAPFGRFVRMESAISVGVPDWHYTAHGASGWLECKLLPPSGRCPEHFTLDQMLWGIEEVRHGGRWHLLGLCLIGRRRIWRLYDVDGAIKWRAESKSAPLVEAEGRFPRREIFRHLAPPQSLGMLVGSSEADE
jgi:hypothetical protein